MCAVNFVFFAFFVLLEKRVIGFNSFCKSWLTKTKLPTSRLFFKEKIKNIFQ